MSAIKRQELITDEALQAPLQLAANFNEVVTAINKVIATGKASGMAISSAGSTAKIKQEVTQITEAQKQLASVQRQIAVVTAKNTTEYQKYSTALNAAKNQLKEKAALGDKDAKSVNAQNASVKQLTIALNANREAYRSLTTEEARTSKEGQDLLAIIKQQDQEVKRLNGDMGDHRDNVGDYQGAMKRLKNEMKLANDELLTIGQRLGTDSDEFIKAAEKVGQLKDEIGDLKDSAAAVAGSPLENLGSSFGTVTSKLKNLDFKGAADAAKQFAAVSKTVTFKEASAGLGSFGKTIGTVGKAILTNPLFILSAVIIGLAVAVVALRDKIKPLAIAFDFVGDAIQRVVQLGKDFLDFVGATTFAADEKAEKIISAANRELDFINKRYDQEIKLAAAAGKDVYDLEKKKYEDIISESAAGMNSILALQKNHGGKMTDEEKKQFEDYIEIVASANNELAILEAKKNKDAEDKRKEAFLKEQGDLFKLQQFRLQVAIENQQLIIDSEKKGQGDRQNAVKERIELEKKLAVLIRDNALKEEGITNSARKLANEQYHEAIKDTERKGQDELNKIQKQGLDEAEKLRKDSIERTKVLSEKRVTEIQNQLEREVQIIKQATIDGYYPREEAEKAIEKLYKETADDIINEQINGLNNLLSNEKLTADERYQVEQELFKLRMALTDAYYKNLEKKELTGLEKTKKILEESAKLYAEFSSAISDLFSAFSDRRIQKLEIESEKVDEEKERQLESEAKFTEAQLANETLSQEQKDQIKAQSEARKAVIEDQAAKRQEQIEKKKQAEEVRRARFEKVSALIGAAVNTALAITKVIGQGGIFGIPLVPVVAALGAIQIAAIAAQPIPKYAMGTDSHKGGLAVLGDGGGPEMYVTPSGHLGISPGKDTVMNLPRGTKVFTADETSAMRGIAMQGIGSMQMGDRRGTNEDIKKELRGIAREIKNKKEVTVTGQVTGYRKTGTRVRYLQSLRNG